MANIKRKKAKPTWKPFFGAAMLDLTDDEVEQLEREYPLHSNKTRHRNEIHHSDNQETDESEEDEIIMEPEEAPYCCTKGCLQELGLHKIHQRRQRMVGMDKREQDIAILAQLACGVDNDLNAALNRQRTRFIYRFDKKTEICRTAFQYIHLVRESRFKRLKQLASQGILVPFKHGNTKRNPNNLLPQDDQEKVIQFIENFIEVHGLPMPGGMRDGYREILLPSQLSYLSIWRDYEENIAEEEKEKTAKDSEKIRTVGYDTFKKIWQQSFWYAKFQKNRSDLCDYCQDIKDKLRFCENEEETSNILEGYKQHTDIVLKARGRYKDEIEQSKEQWSTLPTETRQRMVNNLSEYDKVTEQDPCSQKLTMHYSFDFAQQVHYPYSCQQKGKEYFISPRKCQVFGVCAEALSRQVLFLVDEEETRGKGSLAVISMLDAFFQFHGLGETEAKLHADNCVGQNKNNFVMWYLLWRVMNGLHERITISFMPPGHTKFSPDSYFGLFKIRYRKSTIDSLQDLVECAQNACKKGIIVPQTYGKHLGSTEPLYEYRDWAKYLEKLFKPIDHVTQYNYFTFDSSKPGWIGVGINPDDEPMPIFILKKRYFSFQQPTYYPPAVTPDGLEKDREEYLFKFVRPHVRDPKKRDITCPKPLQKPKLGNKT